MRHLSPAAARSGRWRAASRAGLGAAVAAGLGLGSWALAGTADDVAPPTLTAATAPAPTASPAVSTTNPEPDTDGEAVPSQSPTTKKKLPAGVTPADRRAGIRSPDIPDRGTGRLRIVPGDSPAPNPGRVVRVRVEVEGGLDIARADFASFVLDTLNHDRSWGHDGEVTFARTDGDADVRVVLASPQTSAALCRPLITYGRLSCRSGDMAILTLYRWVEAIQEYGSNRTGYRRYVVNHEVGHFLGHGHVGCPGQGRRAPVMMQQTKSLNGCRPNPWPWP